MNVPLDEEIEDAGEERAPDQVPLQTFKKVAKVMSEVPSKAEWTEMEGSGLNADMLKCAEHSVHVSVFYLIYIFFIIDICSDYM